jgi:FkbM family methyltransferase
MKKVFLDCGTNLCQGLQAIQALNNMDSSWEIYSFEANPITYNTVNHEKFPHVEFLNKAVWTENTKKSLSIEKWPSTVLERDGASNMIDKTSQDNWIGGGCNIMGDEFRFINSPEQNIQRNAVEVECIDLCEFIKERFNKEDHIVIKLDVEGAEYPILEKMIKENIIDYVNIFYVEFHNHMLETQYDEQHIRNELSNRNIKLVDWL